MCTVNYSVVDAHKLWHLIEGGKIHGIPLQNTLLFTYTDNTEIMLFFIINQEKTSTLKK